MKKYLSLLLLLISSFTVCNAQLPTGSWKYYYQFSMDRNGNKVEASHLPVMFLVAVNANFGFGLGKGLTVQFETQGGISAGPEGDFNYVGTTSDGDYVYRADNVYIGPSFVYVKRNNEMVIYQGAMDGGISHVYTR